MSGMYFGEDGTLCPFIEGRCMTMSCMMYRDGDCRLADAQASTDFMLEQLDDVLMKIWDTLLAIAASMGVEVAGDEQ